MTMEYPKRKNIRLNDYDYSSAGAYFITICTKNRQFELSQIFRSCNCVGADIIRPSLTQYGKIVEKAIDAISNHYPEVTIDKYVIMPDHIHLILTITSPETNGRIISAPTKPIRTIIGQMKRWVSKEIGISIWQKSYYDHVIRDENDYTTKWNYINKNPLSWFINKENEPEEVTSNDKL